MATHFGSDGSVKLVTSGGSVATVGELLNWTVTMTTDAVETTSMGDTNRTYVKGLSTGSGSMSLLRREPRNLPNSTKWISGFTALFTN